MCPSCSLMHLSTSAPATLLLISWQGHQQFSPKFIHCPPHVSALFPLFPQVTLCRPGCCLSSCLPGNPQLPGFGCQQHVGCMELLEAKAMPSATLQPQARKAVETLSRLSQGVPGLQAPTADHCSQRLIVITRYFYPRILLPYYCCRVEMQQPGPEVKSKLGLHPKGCH